MHTQLVSAAIVTKNEYSLTLEFFFQLFNSSHLKAFDWGSPDLNLVHFNQVHNYV